MNITQWHQHCMEAEARLARQEIYVSELIRDIAGFRRSQAELRTEVDELHKAFHELDQE